MTILQEIQMNKDGCLDNPNILSDYLVKLSASIIDAEEAKTLAEVKYTAIWIKKREDMTSDKQADQHMKLEEEYVDLKFKEAMCKTLIETIRSVKKRLAFLTIEFNELTI